VASGGLLYGDDGFPVATEEVEEELKYHEPEEESEGDASSDLSSVYLEAPGGVEQIELPRSAPPSPSGSERGLEFHLPLGATGGSLKMPRDRELPFPSLLSQLDPTSLKEEYRAEAQRLGVEKSSEEDKHQVPVLSAVDHLPASASMWTIVQPIVVEKLERVNAWFEGRKRSVMSAVSKQPAWWVAYSAFLWAMLGANTVSLVLIMVLLPFTPVAQLFRFYKLIYISCASWGAGVQYLWLMWAWLGVFRNFSRLTGRVASWYGRTKKMIRRWWRAALEDEVLIWRWKVKQYYVYLFALILACAVGLVAVILRKRRAESEKKKEDEIVLQSGLADWCRDERQRALLNASLFVASLACFGNLKTYRHFSPFVSFLGWMGKVLPNDGSASGCVKAPNCRSQKASGPYLCSDCAASEAARQLENPRFMNPGRFDREKSYAALCEDLITKTDVQWFLKAGPEIQKAVVTDSEILKDIASGSVVIQVSQFDSKPMIQSTRGPLTIASLAHKRLFVSAGLLSDQVSRQIDAADEVSTERGIGWKVSTFGKLSIDTDEKYGKPMTDTEQLSLLHSEPDLSEVMDDDSSYWLYLKNGSLTVWKQLPVQVNSWAIRARTWKNSIPGMSSALDLVLILVAALLVYMAYSASYDTIASWLSWAWTRLWGERVEVESLPIEPEGRGIKNAHVRRATGAQEHRRRVMPDEAVSDMIWKRQHRDGQDFAEQRVKFKNFVLYDLHDIEKQLKAGGLGMTNPSGQKVRVTDLEEYDQARQAGYRVDSATIKSVPSLSLPLAAVQTTPELAAALKLLQFHYNYRERSSSPQLRLSTVQVKLLEKYLGDQVSLGSASLKKAFERATAPSKGQPSRQEIEEFHDFRTDGIDVLDVESGFVVSADTDSKVTFQGPIKPDLGRCSSTSGKTVQESNVQILQSNRCAQEANGLKCKIKGCPRTHANQGEIRTEALVHPEHREIDPACFYTIHLMQRGEMTKVGSASATSYGFLTARHVLFGTDDSPHVPLETVEVRDWQGRVAHINPLTVHCPRAGQLSPGQMYDFCKFRTDDVEFNLAANKVRVPMRNLKSQSDQTVVRMLRSPRDNLRGSTVPVVEAGAITSIDRATAMVMSTLNTLPSDSGAPVFDIDGHQIGIHHGAVVGKGVNVFLLLYPTSAVPWFCQSEPGFQ
jgi:hypothetical protein